MRWPDCRRRERGECQWRGRGPVGLRTGRRNLRRTWEPPEPPQTEPEEPELAVVESPAQEWDSEPSLLEAPGGVVEVLVLVEDQQV